MNLRRISILFGKELRHGTRSFIFFFATVIPVAISLIVSLVFGQFFSETPRIGIINEGDSHILALFEAKEYIDTRVYTDASTLRADVEYGVLDMGLIIPAGFDSAVSADGTTDLTIYFWGEAQTTSLSTLVMTLASNVVVVAGRDIPVTVEPIMLGEGEIVSWSERLLPLLVLMSIVLGGTLVPAVSLVDEKQLRTLGAVTITPASLYDVLAAKALLGVGLSLTMGVVILVLNRAFGTHPALLVALLGLGAMAAAVFGVLLGIISKDMAALFTVIKSLGIVLYAPALIELVPGLPGWVAQLFPTYYLISPIQKVALNGADFSEVGGQVVILIGLITVLIGALVMVVSNRQQRQLLPG